MKIELQEMVDQRYDRNGVPLAPRPFNMDKVFVDGNLIGFAPHGKDAAILYLAEYSEEVKHLVEYEVNKRDKSTVKRRTAVAPSIGNGNDESEKKDSDD